MDYKERTVSSKKIFNGKVINLRVDEVELPDGRTGTREIVEHNGGVAVVAVKEGKIILVRQYRKPVESCLLELPAGKLEKGEDPYECGARELQEETGYIPESLKLLTSIYTTPGFSSEKLYIYLADSLREGSLNRDEDEFLDVLYYDVEEVVDMIYKGIINDAKTICGVLMYASFIQNCKIKG